MSCKRAGAFLSRRDVAVRETVNASKQRIGKSELKQLFAGATSLIVAKGKSIQVFDLKKNAPSEEELAAAVLGPTGNLRAPSIRLGTSWLIGFNEEAYTERFG